MIKKRFCSLFEDVDWTPWLDMLNCRTFRGRVLRHSSNNPGCLFWSGRFDLPPSESWLLQFWKAGSPLFSSSSFCTRVLVFCNLSGLSLCLCLYSFLWICKLLFLVSLHQSVRLLLIAYLRRAAVRVCRNIINMVINIITITKVIIINITINAIIIFVVTMSYDCLFETGSRQSVPQDRINCS